MPCDPLTSPEADFASAFRRCLLRVLSTALYLFGALFIAVELDEARRFATTPGLIYELSEPVFVRFRGSAEAIVQHSCLAAAILCAGLFLFFLRRKAWPLGLIGALVVVEVFLCETNPID